MGASGSVDQVPVHKSYGNRNHCERKIRAGMQGQSNLRCGLFSCGKQASHQCFRPAALGSRAQGRFGKLSLGFGFSNLGSLAGPFFW